MIPSPHHPAAMVRCIKRGISKHETKPKMTLNSITFDLDLLTWLESFWKEPVPEIYLLQYQRLGYSDCKIMPQRVKSSKSAFYTFSVNVASGSTYDNGFPGSCRRSI